MLEMHACTDLIQRIYSFIGKEAVRNVALRQFDAGGQRHFVVTHMMMLFVVAFYIMQNSKCFLARRRLNHHLLETALQRTILLNGVAILLKRRGTNKLECPTCQGWFQNICSIHTPR